MHPPSCSPTTSSILRINVYPDRIATSRPEDGCAEHLIPSLHALPVLVPLLVQHGLELDHAVLQLRIRADRGLRSRTLKADRGPGPGALGRLGGARPALLLYQLLEGGHDVLLEEVLVNKSGKKWLSPTSSVEGGGEPVLGASPTSSVEGGGEQTSMGCCERTGIVSFPCCRRWIFPHLKSPARPAVLSWSAIELYFQVVRRVFREQNTSTITKKYILPNDHIFSNGLCDYGIETDIAYRTEMIQPNAKTQDRHDNDEYSKSMMQ